MVKRRTCVDCGSELTTRGRCLGMIDNKICSDGRYINWLQKLLRKVWRTRADFLASKLEWQAKAYVLAVEGGRISEFQRKGEPWDACCSRLLAKAERLNKLAHRVSHHYDDASSLK